MNAVFTGYVVEDAALAWLEGLGWAVKHGLEIAPGELAAERDNYGQVVLEQRLKMRCCPSSFPAKSGSTPRRNVSRRTPVPDINLTQAEAEALLAMEKRRVDDHAHNYPGLGGDIRIPLTSHDKRENFFLDISRGTISLSKGKYQNRARHVVILARLDFGGAAHRNPDDQEISCPHLHLYREGYGAKWAFPLPAESFTSPEDLWQTLIDFMRYCHIIEPPIIIRGLSQ
jgi:hypothetical protein